jgi:hypothetical protein
MAYKEFNKANVKDLRADINSLLESYAAENNLTINIGNISYDNATVSCKGFLVAIKGASSPKRLRISKLTGFNANAYDETFVHDGDTYKITALKPKNKRQVVAVNEAGQSFIFPKNMVFNARPDLKA